MDFYALAKLIFTYEIFTSDDAYLKMLKTTIQFFKKMVRKNTDIIQYL